MSNFNIPIIPKSTKYNIPIIPKSTKYATKFGAILFQGSI
jgi:hypothetical protein